MKKINISKLKFGDVFYCEQDPDHYYIFLSFDFDKMKCLNLRTKDEVNYFDPFVNIDVGREVCLDG